MSIHPNLTNLVNMKGKVALVTGACGSIGSAIANLFGEAGATVVGSDLASASHSETSAPIISCDLCDPSQIVKLIETVCDEYEGLDSLVHCAGVRMDSVLWKMTDEQWRSVMQVNLDSAFHLLRHAAPVLRERGGGNIVLITSINGERGKFGQANYSASKAGLIGLGRTAARELGKFGVRVNMIAPGLIETAMTKDLSSEQFERAVNETVLGHCGSPQDVATVALFLCTEMSSHVTGQVLRVDGGQLIA